METNTDNTAVEKKEEDMSPKEKAFMLLAQGKRHYLVKDYFEAVGCLATACELLAEVYGEAANECGDAYFSYGKALLGLAREENGVLGDAVEEREDEEEENEQEEQEAGVEDNCEKEESAKHENEKVEDTAADSAPTVDSEPVGSEDNVEVDGEKDEDDAETVSNLKLAWEMLELVKIIFQRQADSDQNIKLKLAEVHMYLGEIGLESENYTSAIEDINRCLEIRKKLLKTDDRCVAETLYQLGLAHSLASNFDESIKYFSEAVEVLEERIKILEQRKDSGGEVAEESKSDAFYTIDGEITEIKALLPEIKDKIQDMKDFKNETLKAMFEKRCEDQQGSSGQAGTSSASLSTSAASTESKPVSNITHLVRKKRRSDPESE
ncbi:nuclear autoantigenic sperm protein isoform X2 [Schistocerca gregaria]|uniref:nuclear autoantigenic sperm protein isoform X2 n=1 Tax=Schistocerca gregaria TaxID=7010 RepID=UPI00211DC56A|nr:nuclear autoantigenic sperm protein isoform X2 [Schistocerca gregaria]XP_049827771.1 nuclear autoantigenic sperm protein isoform X2 [Schistocerca gregaria]